MKKGQATLEALIAVILAIAAFAFIASLSYEKQLETTNTEAFLAKKDLCLKVSNNINGIFTSGDGAVSKIKDTYYDVFFDGPGREIFVGDARCSIPVDKITNGINSTFTIPKGVMQVENKDNIIYVSSNCIINAPEYAEVGDINTSTAKIVTSLVKEDDDKYAEIGFIGIPGDERVGNSGFYSGGNEVKIAYLRLGTHCTESELMALLGEYSCDNYDEDVGTTKCDIFFNAESIDDFFEDEIYEDYGIYIIEDVQNAVGSDEVEILKDEVAGGKWMFFSGRFGDSGLKFNISYFDNQGNAPATVQNYTNQFFQLQEGSQYYGTKKHMAATKNNSIDSYVTIARFTNSFDAMSTWDYGNGFIFFVSDICEDDIVEALRLSLEKIIGLKGSGWLYSSFILTPLLNSLSVESADFSINHKVNDTSVYIANITYRDVGNWIEICTNLTGSLTEKTNTCSINNVIGDRVETIVSFDSTPNDFKEAFVDVESIRVCYNDTISA